MLQGCMLHSLRSACMFLSRVACPLAWEYFPHPLSLQALSPSPQAGCLTWPSLPLPLQPCPAPARGEVPASAPLSLSQAQVDTWVDHSPRGECRVFRQGRTGESCPPSLTLRLAGLSAGSLFTGEGGCPPSFLSPSLPLRLSLLRHPVLMHSFPHLSPPLPTCLQSRSLFPLAPSQAPTPDLSEATILATFLE